MILGAVGTGKTSACMYPYVDQLLRWHAQDPTQEVGGLVLEVKGDFCRQVRQIVRAASLGTAYLEIGLGTAVCYNPLHNDLDPYAVAYAIGSLLNNLFGKSKEPFWQQAFTDLLSSSSRCDGLPTGTLRSRRCIATSSKTRDAYIRPPKPGAPRPLPPLEDLRKPDTCSASILPSLRIRHWPVVSA